MKVEIKCLFCEGVDVMEHRCSNGTMDGAVLRAVCIGKHHRDFCTQCTKILNASLAKQFVKKKKLRLEGE